MDRLNAGIDWHAVCAVMNAARRACVLREDERTAKFLRQLQLNCIQTQYSVSDHVPFLRVP